MIYDDLVAERLFDPLAEQDAREAAALAAMYADGEAVST